MQRQTDYTAISDFYKLASVVFNVYFKLQTMGRRNAFIIAATTTFVSFIHLIYNPIVCMNRPPKAYTFQKLFQTSSNKRKVNNISINVDVFSSEIDPILCRTFKGHAPQS